MNASTKRILYRFIVLNLIILQSFNFVQAENYAVLISAGKVNPQLGNKGDDWPRNSEYWYDLVLMYETLYNAGWSDENIFVLYGDGEDFISSRGYYRISNKNWDGITEITDYNNSKGTIYNVFNNLSNIMTSNDNLFVWWLGHGVVDGPGTELEFWLQNTDRFVRDDELASYVADINCNKKIFFIMTCFSARIFDDLQNNDTFIISAITAVFEAESYCYDNWHEDAFYHLFCALNGYTPGYYPDDIDADDNNDGFIDLIETYNYAWDNKKLDLPQYNDLGNIGNDTYILSNRNLVRDIGVYFDSVWIGQPPCTRMLTVSVTGGIGEPYYFEWYGGFKDTSNPPEWVWVEFEGDGRNLLYESSEYDNYTLFKVIVRDDNGNEGEGVWKRPPIITPIVDRLDYTLIGETYTFAWPLGAIEFNIDFSGEVKYMIEPYTVEWSKVSDPQTPSVTFNSANNLTTTATFTGLGTYEIELTADDGTDIVSEILRINFYGDSLIPPENMIASVISYKEVKLEWDYNLSDPKGFLVQRKTTGDFETITDDIAGNNRFWNDKGLYGNTTYIYRICAYNDAETSGWSNTDTTTTFVAPNFPPIVNAGDNIWLSWPDEYQTQLDGDFHDDGLPNPPGELVIRWRKLSGPGTVAFSDSTIENPTVTFDAEGIYVLQLSADDNFYIETDEVRVYLIRGDLSDPTTVTLRPHPYNGKDVYLSENYPTTVWDTEQLILGTKEGAEGSTVRSLVAFDLSGIPQNSVIADAAFFLKFKGMNHDSSTQTFDIYKVLKPWEKTEACWDVPETGEANWNGCEPNGISASITPVSSFTKNQWEENYYWYWGDAGMWNMVQGWVTDPTSNHGMLLKLADDTSSVDREFRFYASDCDEEYRRPRLEVTYKVYALADTNTVWRINTGSDKHYIDGDSKLWEADTTAYATGGYGYVSGSTGATTDDAIKYTTADKLYQTERWGMSGYKFDVPDSVYTVKLYLAEIYYHDPDERKMSVTIEGETVLNDLDIYAHTGHDAALCYTFVTEVTDGTLDIGFGQTTDYAKVSAIEVLQGDHAEFRDTWRINAGGSEYTDGENNLWLADQEYEAGGYGYVGWSTMGETSDDIAGTDDDALYQNNRFGMSQYLFDAPDTAYTVTLHFSEHIFTWDSGRIMGVVIEGDTVLNNFSIHGVAGHDSALSYTYVTEVTDRRLEIDFFATMSYPLISAIEMKMCLPVVDPPTGLIASAVSGSQIKLSWTDNSDDELGFQIERRSSSDTTFSVIDSVGTNICNYTNESLTELTTYYYRIRAYNHNNVSEYTNEAGAITLGGVSTTFEIRVSEMGGDGFEFVPEGWVDRDHSYINIGSDKIAGVHFKNINIDQGRTITKAYIQFTVDNDSDILTTSTITGHDVDDSWSISTSVFTLSTRARTSASVIWNIPPWPTVGASGEYQRTSNLAMIVQEIVNRSGWSSGNSMFFIFEQSEGWRSAVSWDGSTLGAPLLHIEYTTPLPVAPDSLYLTTVSESQINLFWMDKAEFESGFKIERKTGEGGTYNVIDSVSTNVQFYSDMTLSDSTTYYYRVCSYNGTGDSDYSNEAYVMTHTQTVSIFEKRVNEMRGDGFEFVPEGWVDRDHGYITISSTKIPAVYFSGINITQGKTITNAYIQFAVDDDCGIPTTSIITGHDVDDSWYISTLGCNISARVRTSYNSVWNIPAWPTTGVSGLDQRTSNIASIVQEIVNRPGWTAGNDMFFIFEQSEGWRNAVSWDGNSSQAPLLHVEYTTNGLGKALFGEDQETSRLPETFSLDQNYPNPFNPETKIKYALPEDQNVALKVFDIRGRTVATLVDEKQPAGWYDITLDGSEFASGVYIYRIITEKFTKTKKMLLLK